MLLPKSDRDAVIVAACRTPIGKVTKKGGAFSNTRPEDLGAAVVNDLLRRVPISPDLIEDGVFGCAIPEGPQGMNIGRNIVLRSCLPISVPGMTVSRFCASGLQAISDGACRIRAGQADIVVAGGVESMSMLFKTLLPMLSPMQASDEHNCRLHPDLLRDTHAFITTIEGAEVLRKAYGISRKEQDEFALESHRRAVQAQDEGKFKEEIVPIKTLTETVISSDEGPRRDSTMEKLSSLEAEMKGRDPASTVTAGNASQVSDGAAGVLLMSRGRAAELGFKPLARFVDYTVTAVRPENFGIGPFDAIRAILRRTSLTKSDIGLIELNEAFAVQVLAVLRCMYIDRDILNVNGGAIALGHPLGCSGARIAATLIYEMRRRGVEFGLETMCIGGGMGAAGIFQLED